MTAYYGLLEAGPAGLDRGRLRALLADDLRFEGPIARHRVGADPFVEGVAGLVTSAGSLHHLRRLCDGPLATALHDAELPRGTVHFAEIFEVADGTIRSLQLPFDPSASAAAGSR